MKFAFILKEKANFAVAFMCRHLEVTRSGFYAWHGRPESAHGKEDRRLKVHIRAFYEASKKRYGSPRIHQDLKADGERLSRKRVGRLMREERLAARKKRRFTKTTDSGHSLPIAGNVLARGFKVSEPNQKWSGDITYLKTKEGWLYLAVLLDLFSRRVVGWSVDDSLEATGAGQALKMATSTRQVKPGLIHHTERGVQYASEDYRNQMDESKMIPSMSRKGNCWDNAVAESFFSSLKTEVGDLLKGGASRTDVRSAVSDYMSFYNSKRRHSSLGYLSPMDYETSARVGRAA